ncbi:MAG: hypothetical protein DCC68_01785 [Planctomycetota bacterium]|nr:MAG: hypothetical protein DCC68_01785 [Planctomycetota bacterium]
MATDASSSFATHSFDADLLASVVAKNAPAMGPEEAQLVLNWRFSDAEVARMHELAQKNRDDALSPNEREELESFLRVGQFLNILHAKARASLAKSNGE